MLIPKCVVERSLVGSQFAVQLITGGFIRICNMTRNDRKAASSGVGKNNSQAKVLKKIRIFWFLFIYFVRSINL